MKGPFAIGGTLLPAEYIADRLLLDADASVPGLARLERRIQTWWRMVEQSCGPASGLRALLDRFAMPLAAALGYTARDIVIGHKNCSGLLDTSGKTTTPFLLLPWSDRPASLWRDASTLARHAGTRWCVVLAPPFLSVVDARGWAIRRSVDVFLPHVLAGDSLRRFYAIVSAGAFERLPAAPTRLERLVERAAGFQDRVRTDLQLGVLSARRLLADAVRLISKPPHARMKPSRHAAVDDQALTIVYRILFMLFAESRGLAARGPSVIADGYSMSRLCGDALTGQARYSLWDGLAAITRMARSGASIDQFEAPPFNSGLFAAVSAPAAERRRAVRRPTQASMARERLLREALTALGSRAGQAGRQRVHYADLGVEELGAVYERLLDDTPDAPAELSSHGPHSDVRKRTGTFYTPQPLADFIVRRTIAPLVEHATSDQILALRVVDPAMGSGAFLVSACRYLEAAYGRALVDEGQLSADDLDENRRAGFRRVIAERCLAGVDSNPVAVQLARLSLWLATLSAGRPLSFLDHRLRVGNSLIGAEAVVLDTMAAGRRARRPAGALFEAMEIDEAIQRGGQPLQLLLDLPADTLRDVKTKEALWRQMTSDRSTLAPWRDALSLWCAHWFWPAGSPRPSDAERRALVDAILRGDRTLGSEYQRARLASLAEVVSAHRFFHWPLEFPDVFGGHSPHVPRGFDIVIGNPPWEMLRKDAHGGVDAGRQKLGRFIRESGRYPSCDRGHVNLYQPFVDRALSLVRPGGRVGLVLPWGLAVDDGAAGLRRRLLDTTAIDTIVGFDNARRLFPIHRGLRFLAMVTTTGRATDRIRLRFGMKTREELADLADHDDPLTVGDQQPLTITRSQLAKIGGRQERLPDLRRPHDLAFLEGLAARFPAFGTAESWQATFGRELNATEVKPHLTARGLPILEGKHIDRYQVVGRSASRIERSAALRLLPDARFERARLGYRDVSGAANSRSMIASVIPAGMLTTHTILCLRTDVTDEQQHFLCGLLNSFVINGVARLLMGGHLTTSLVEGFPIPAWSGSPRQGSIARLARELARRPGDRAADATLEAHVACLYSIDEPAFASLLSGFPLVPVTVRNRALSEFRRLFRERA